MKKTLALGIIFSLSITANAKSDETKEITKNQIVYSFKSIDGNLEVTGNGKTFRLENAIGSSGETYRDLVNFNNSPSLYYENTASSSAPIVHYTLSIKNDQPIIDCLYGDLRNPRNGISIRKAVCELEEPLYPDYQDIIYRFTDKWITETNSLNISNLQTNPNQPLTVSMGYLGAIEVSMHYSSLDDLLSGTPNTWLIKDGESYDLGKQRVYFVYNKDGTLKRLDSEIDPTQNTLRKITEKDASQLLEKINNTTKHQDLASEKHKSKITLSKWNNAHHGWLSIVFTGGKEFSIYTLNARPNKYPGVSIEVPKKYISPQNNYLAIHRTEYGSVWGSTKEAQRTEKSHCDIIDLSNGCVMLTRPSEYCSGTWNDEVWITDDGEKIEPAIETPSPNQILENLKPLNLTSKATAIREYLFMGAESYMACHSPRKNIQPLNDIGYYLSENGDTFNALKIFRALEAVAPSRIVLKLNIADTLWSEGKLDESKKYYFEYSEQMKQQGKSKIIPQRVLNRLAEHTNITPDAQ